MTTNQKTKEELKNEALMHQQAIEKEFHDIVEEGKETAKKAAYITGGVLAAYLVIRLLTRKKVVTEEGDHSKRRIFKVEENKSSIVGSVGKMLLTQASLLAIGFAKNKIKHYLENLISPDEEDSDS
jgi:hypothetical protein